MTDDPLDGLGDEYDEAEELAEDSPPESTEPVTCVGCRHRKFFKGTPWSRASRFTCLLTGYDAIRRCKHYEEG